MSNEEIEKNARIGTLFCLSSVFEYTEMLTGILEGHASHKDRYEYNKAKEVNKACRMLYKSIYRGILRDEPKESEVILNEAINRHCELVTDFFILDFKDQKRVRGLIQKIKRENKIIL